MEYLKNLGSAAVSSLVQKSGFNFPFSLGSKVTTTDNIYSLYDGIKRDDGSPISVFEYDLSDSSKKNIKQFATNAMRKLRSTRHPDILKFLDAVETDSVLYIMTERVRPLQPVLDSWSNRASSERDDWLIWGLQRISVALAFLNDPCSSTYGKLSISSIFVSSSGEWKLGGFELLSNPKDEMSVLYTLGGLYPSSMACGPPEVKKDGWAILKQADPASADGYALGLLLHSLFNPLQPPPAAAQPPYPPPTQASRGAIPTSIFPSFKKFLNPSPKARMTPKTFLEIGMAETGFFATNKLVQVCIGLDNFALSSEADRIAFLRNLKSSASSFPSEFATDRVLPSLASALEFGGSSVAAILPLILQLGASLGADQYSRLVLDPVVKLFASPDRSTRMALLDSLSEYAERLDKKTVSEKIFPHLQTGFTDTVAIIREATLKSFSLLASKLNDRILNNDLLRALAKLQSDPEASIRTNTCILIGRLGPSLGYHTKRKVLVPAFARAIRDPFVHARVAGLMAFMATIECFEAEDMATKVIPNISIAMVDKDRLVREQAFKAVDLFVKKLESHSSTMPETELTSKGDSALPNSNETTLVNTAAGAATTLASWAISSLGKRLVSPDLQSSIGDTGGTTTLERPTSAPPLGFGDNSLNGLNPGSTLTRAISEANTPLQSPFSAKPKGMQLGSSRTPSSLASSFVADNIINELVEDEQHGNLWGNDDLIDINADQDDWSAFETASSPKHRNVHSDVHKSPPPVPSLSIFSSTPPSMARSRPPAASKTMASAQPQSSIPVKDSAPPVHLPEPAAPPTKEQRAAEMLRRKEERKQRIALLKEQKKSAARS